MSIERFAHVHMPILPNITQRAWHDYCGAERLRAHAACVFCATNWIIDLPHSLFLDLNDILGNFSNCHDLICTPSPACWVVDVKGEGRGLEVPSHLKRGTTLRSTFIQARRNSHNSFFFPLSPPPSCQRPSRLICHPLALLKLDFTIGRKR